MKIGISLKINVSEIEKARLFTGKKGKYLDATTFVDLDELDQYGNSGMITQDVSKEEKEQGTRGRILGNSKVFWKGEGQQSQQAPQQSSIAMPQRTEAQMEDDDQIPFIDPYKFNSLIV